MDTNHSPQFRLDACPPLTFRLLPTLVWSGSLGVLLTGLSGLLYGTVGVEKMLTVLSFPIQTSWLLLSGWLLQCLQQRVWMRRTRYPCLTPLILWSAFTLCGSPWLSDGCYRYLESRETLFDPEKDPPLDWLVVLGGGTSQGPSRAEATAAGDRVLMAAQLYINGHAQHLITTGSDILGNFHRKTSPASQTNEIWLKLGVSPEAIETLPGINTSAEMQALSKKVQDRLQDLGNAPSTQPLRIGILTSAWHLPRAMRLARAAGLKDMIPVAADHESRVDPHLLWDYIPSANGFLRLEHCQKEFMAALVSR